MGEKDVFANRSRQDPDHTMRSPPQEVKVIDLPRVLRSVRDAARNYKFSFSTIHLSNNGREQTRLGERQDKLVSKQTQQRGWGIHLPSADPTENPDEVSFANVEVDSLESRLCICFGPWEISVFDWQHLHDFEPSGNSSPCKWVAYLVSELQVRFLNQFTGIRLELIRRKEWRKALYGNDSLNDVWSNLTELNKGVGVSKSSELMIFSYRFHIGDVP